MLEKLALVESKIGPAPDTEDLQVRIAPAARGLHIVLTCRPRGYIPTNHWGNSYPVFVRSL